MNRLLCLTQQECAGRGNAVARLFGIVRAKQTGTLPSSVLGLADGLPSKSLDGSCEGDLALHRYILPVANFEWSVDKSGRQAQRRTDSRKPVVLQVSE